MKLFLSYQLLQLKRIFRKLPLLLIFSLLFFTAVGIMAAVFSHGEKKYTVALAGNTEDPYLKFAVDALQRMDSSRFSIDLVLMSEEEARKQLSADEINAYVNVPDGFIESINNGSNNLRIEFVSNEGGEAFNDIVKNEIAQIISTLVVHSQSGIFSMQYFLRRYGKPSMFNALTYELNIKYVDWVLSRSSFYTLEHTGFSSSVSMAGYLICSILVFFIMSLGTAASFFFVNRQQSLEVLLKSRRLSFFRQITAEGISYYLFVLLNFLIAVIIIYAASVFKLLPVREWQKYGSSSSLRQIAAAGLLVCAVISSMELFFYEVVRGKLSSVLLASTMTLILCWTGGCFYPVSFFPDELQSVLSASPVSACINCLSDAFREKNFVSPAVLAYPVIFICASAFIRYKRNGGVK